MSTSTQSRVHAGVPTGGQYAAAVHSDAVPALSAPTANDDFVASRLGEFGFAGRMSPEEIAEVTKELNASRDFRDENIAAVADQVHLDTAGHTLTDLVAASEGLDHLTRLGHEDEAAALRRVLGMEKHAAPEADVFSVPGTNTRLHVLRPEPADGITVPVPANDPRLLAGQVFDKVMAPDGTVFHRRREGVYPDWPDRIRVQASRPLREDEKLQMAGLLGYAYRAQVRGEGLSMPESDSPYSFIVGTDTTKTRSDDLGMALERFEEDLPTLFMEGSPARKTNRTGPIGSRLVEGLGDPDLTFELYYDDVSGD
jgi:hypothetical protein